MPVCCAGRGQHKQPRFALQNAWPGADGFAVSAGWDQRPTAALGASPATTGSRALANGSEGVKRDLQIVARRHGDGLLTIERLQHELLGKGGHLSRAWYRTSGNMWCSK